MQFQIKLLDVNRSETSIKFPLAAWCLAGLLSGIALILSSLLMFESLTGQGIAGCGVGSSCNVVLASRWSKVLGEPVATPATAVYLIMLLLLWQLRPWRAGRSSDAFAVALLRCGAGLIAAAAIWFIALQATVIGTWCFWCTTTHVAGLLLAGLLLGFLRFRWRPMAVGLVAAGVLVLLQIFGPAPVTAQVQYSRAGNYDRGQGEQRSVAVLGGAVKLSPATLPTLGDPDARMLLVEVMDYTCPFCKQLHEQLAELRSQQPGEYLIVVLPTPLSSACNTNLRTTNPGHTEACDIARYMLAIWFDHPDQFAAAHNAVMRSHAHTLAEVEQVLTEATPGGLPTVSDEALREADAMIQRNVKLQSRLGPAMPQLIVGSLAIQGRTYSVGQLKELIEQNAISRK